MRVAAVATLAAAIACPTMTARAQLSSTELGDASRALATYDPVASVLALAELTRIAERATRSAPRREARFVRAVGAVELLVLAFHSDRPDLAASVARALGVAPDQARDTLARDLRALSFGAYGPTAREAQGALDALTHLAAGQPASWERAPGVRGDILFVAAVRRALPGGVAAMAEHGQDPCADDCAEPFARFDVTGRRAVAALEQALHCLTRLERAARAGDPFAQAMASALDRDREALAAAVLRPVPHLGPALRLSPATGAPLRGAPPALIISVGAGAVRIGWVPQVRVTEDGAGLEVFADGEPMLPATLRIGYGRNIRPVLGPIPGLTRRLAAIVGASGADAAVGASARAPAHMLVRVLLSAQRAGIATPLIVGRTAEGYAGGVHVRLLRGRGTRSLEGIRVHVRLGGYSLVTDRGSHEIPRVRAPEGPMRFDVGALGTMARQSEAQSAEVSFMSAVGSGPVLAAVFSVAPESEALTLVLP